jgi:hypothetical protein
MLNTTRAGRQSDCCSLQAVEMTEPRKPWKSPTAAFPPLPPLLGNLADGARFPHSHRPDSLRRKEGEGATELGLLLVSRSPRGGAVERERIAEASPVGYNIMCPESAPLAGFEVSLNGRFSGDPRGPNRPAREERGAGRL